MIIATYQDHEVEIVDTFQTGGALVAVVHCIDGSEPFVGGDKWPVRTDWSNILVARLENVREVQAPEDSYIPDEYQEPETIDF